LQGLYNGTDLQGLYNGTEGEYVGMYNEADMQGYNGNDLQGLYNGTEADYLTCKATMVLTCKVVQRY